ncbi:Pancreatic lipase-related protein 1, partial [Habropoda laboriosa]
SEILAVFDDNGNVVPLNTSETNPETLEETQDKLKSSIFFYLHTKKTVDNPELLYLNNVDSVKNSHFDPKKETKFVTHGWMNSRNSPSCTLVVSAFVTHGDYNIIVTDWSAISIMPYIWSSNRVVMVAQYVSKMIDFLVSQGMNTSQVTSVGHSLGGHVAGLAAYYAKTKVNYVVALDPAEPNFLLSGPDGRVSAEDAAFVEVIHTNGGLEGFLNALGHADFFPNGGSAQKGCIVDIGGSCSHLRSVQYYAESINSKVGFVAKSCSSYQNYTLGLCDSNPDGLMGGAEPNFKLKGKYYLNTNGQSPFAKGAK